MFNIIAAMDKNGGIGYRGDLPWPKLKGDMKFYRELTTCPNTLAVKNRYALGTTSHQKSLSSFRNFLSYVKTQAELPPVQIEKPNAVIMGRKTWDSLPDKFRPLPNRLNVILSKKKQDGDEKDVVIAQNLNKVLDYLFSKSITNIFVIGGGRVYEEAIRHPECKVLYVTQIDCEFDCDTYFPDFKTDFSLQARGHSISEFDIPYQFTVFERN